MVCCISLVDGWEKFIVVVLVVDWLLIFVVMCDLWVVL